MFCLPYVVVFVFFTVFSELFGRKYSIVIGAGLFVIGGILQASAVHIGYVVWHTYVH